MNVILTQDVDALGLAGQVVEVANGYARNKLIPGRLAVLATPSNLRMFEKKREEFRQRTMREKEKATEVAQRIAALQVTIAQKAGEKDKLYGSVTSMDLAQAMADQGVDIDRRKIRLEEPIKALGDYDVTIKLHAEVAAKLKVSVVRAE
jgi:large subunit ribosomal protein L9